MNENTKSKKPIIIIIAFLILLIVGLLVYKLIFSNTDDGDTNSNSNGSVKGGSQAIKEIHTSVHNIYALTNSNNIYAIGEDIYGLGKNNTDHDKTVLLASNAKKMDDDTYGNYYINNKGELYKTGYDYYGGILYEYQKITDNVSDFDTFSNFCITIVKNNGDLLIEKKLNNSYCGFDQTEGLKKVASNVKKAVVSYDFFGYLDKSNNLYISVDKGNTFEKVLDNVTDHMRNGTVDFYLTGNGELYSIRVKPGNNENPIDKQLLRNDVEKLCSDNSSIETKDNKFYNAYVHQNWEIEFIEYEMDDNLKNNVSDILYKGTINSWSNTVEVYFSKDNKILLYKDNKLSKALDNNYKNIEEIYKFIQP